MAQMPSAYGLGKNTISNKVHFSSVPYLAPKKMSLWGQLQRDPLQKQYAPSPLVWGGGGHKNIMAEPWKNYPTLHKLHDYEDYILAISLFPRSTQMSMKFFVLINVKMATIVTWLIYHLRVWKQEKFIFQHFNFYEQF